MTIGATVQPSHSPDNGTTFYNGPVYTAGLSAATYTWYISIPLDATQTKLSYTTQASGTTYGMATQNGVAKYNAGSSMITANGLVTHSAVASLASTSTIIVKGLVTHNAVATLNAASTITTAMRIEIAVAALIAESEFVTIGQIFTSGAAYLQGSSSINVGYLVRVFGGFCSTIFAMNDEVWIIPFIHMPFMRGPFMVEAVDCFSTRYTLTNGQTFDVCYLAPTREDALLRYQRQVLEVERLAISELQDLLAFGALEMPIKKTRKIKFLSDRGKK